MRVLIYQNAICFSLLILSCLYFHYSAHSKEVLQSSFTLIPTSKKALYLNLQNRGFCLQVFQMEKKFLIRSSSNLRDWPKEKLEQIALGYQRCKSIRNLAETLAIAKLKGGLKLYSSYAPKPRLGKFDHPHGADIQNLIRDRKDPNAHDRPVDWLEDPMSLEQEKLLHRSYSKLVSLGICHNMPQAFIDLGHYFDQSFALLDPYLLVGIFTMAKQLGIEGAKMQKRINRIDDAFPTFKRIKLLNDVKDYDINDINEMKPLTNLCQ